MRSIYLDYNATTPLAPAAQESMLPFLAEQFGSPTRGYALGLAAQGAVQDARGKVARMLGAAADEIVFTSGGTESNNLALKGAAILRGLGHGHVVISALEHASVHQPAVFLERLGYDLTVVGCDSSGVVSPADVLNALRPDTLLVSIVHANHEIGTVQPLREIAEICRRREILLHSDASQSVGKLPVNVAELGVDLLSIAGHKMYAPKGIGALYVRREVALEPVLHGEGQERGLRAGMENVPAIAALGAAAHVVELDIVAASGRLGMLRERLWERLAGGIGARLGRNGPEARTLPNTLSVNFPGVNGAELLARCPEVLATTGAAAGNADSPRSPALQAIGLPAAVAAGTIRLSLGWYSSEDEIDRAADSLVYGWENLH